MDALWGVEKRDLETRKSKLSCISGAHFLLTRDVTSAAGKVKVVLN
jgi:hypothetical protein